MPAKKERGRASPGGLFDVMDVLADLFHDGIAAFGEQLFVFGYQVVAVGINRDNQRAELFDPTDSQRLRHSELCPVHFFNLFHLGCRQHRAACRENHM